MDTEQKVAAFVCRTQLSDIPADVLDKTKLAILDALGAALSGTLVDVTKISIEFARTCLPGEDATIILGGGKVSTIGAAFANGNAANGFDTDDDNIMVRTNGATLEVTALEGGQPFAVTACEPACGN